jgi:hypothetical protein
MTFWHESGFADPYHRVTDPAPDPALFVRLLSRCQQKWSFFFLFFLLLLLVVCQSSKIKKSYRSHRTVEIKGFLSFLLDDGRIPIRTKIRIRTNDERSDPLKAQKHTDHKDPDLDADPQHWFKSLRWPIQATFLTKTWTNPNKTLKNGGLSRFSTFCKILLKRRNFFRIRIANAVRIQESHGNAGSKRIRNTSF